MKLASTVASRRAQIWLPVVAVLGVVSATGIAVTRYYSGPSEETVAAGRVLFEHEYVVNDPLSGDHESVVSAAKEGVIIVY